MIPKSRYDSVSAYISSSSALRPEYNDINPPIDLEIKERLMKEGGLDEVLANHFGHLFIRDPLVIFEESLEEQDEEGTDHFEVPPSSLFLQTGY